MSSYKDYHRLLDQTGYETRHGAERTKLTAARDRAPEVAELIEQVTQDRTGLKREHDELLAAWEEIVDPEQEPHRDHTKAAKARAWRIGALAMFVIETAFAAWLASSYLAVEQFLREGWLGVVILVVIGLLLTLVATVLFHKILAPNDDLRRPIPSLHTLSRLAAAASAVGIVAVAAFLLTRQYAIGGVILQIALALLTLALAAGAAASLHCAEVLHRPNRIAAKYDDADKLLSRANITSRRLDDLKNESKEPTPPAVAPVEARPHAAHPTVTRMPGTSG